MSTDTASLELLLQERKTLKRRFELKKAAEWEQEISRLEAAIDMEIRNHPKLSIRKLGKLMGTQDWRTAQKRYQQAYAPPPSPLHTAKHDLTATWVQEVDWGGDLSEDWILTDGSNEVTVNVSREFRDMTVLKGDNDAGWSYEDWLNAEKIYPPQETPTGS